MPKWYCEIDGREFSTEDEAIDAALEYVDIYDIENCIGDEIIMKDIIEELARLESPLYWKLLDLAHQRIFEDVSKGCSRFCRKYEAYRKGTDDFPPYS